ncbi:MAG: hypothetical protein CMM07_02795 [Rhodopirellula sp.]|nr:hypothetical protein [Rhodopirellula sp.]
MLANWQKHNQRAKKNPAGEVMMRTVFRANPAQNRQFEQIPSGIDHKISATRSQLGNAMNCT